MAKRLDGKIALVTGASSGIGRACALAFAREGAKVVVGDVNVAGGEETVDLIARAGGQGRFVRTDVSRAAEVEALVRATVEAYGRVDCAHNNAGMPGAIAPLAEYPEEAWDRVLSVNLKGVWLCMKYQIQQMLKQGGGSIVNTSSVAGLVGVTDFSAYSASKHGVIGLTRTAALEYKKAGIRINAICPGGVETPMLRHITRGQDLAKLPAAERAAVMSEIGTPEEVAEAVVWLSSGAASLVTGTAMPLDRGYVAQ